jgi:hypothetical protein
MFLLGMGVNLIGVPSEVSGAAKTATSILLGLHMLIGLGLLVGSIAIVIKGRSSAFVRQIWFGLLTIIITIFCGVMTVATKSNWWSYGMSIGFIANFWIYGLLLFKTRAQGTRVPEQIRR